MRSPETIREDTVRQGLLFVGTETGIYASIDDGKSGGTLNLNMPPVPVHDIEVKNADLIVATHGRGLLDPRRHQPACGSTRPELAAKNAHLFKPETTPASATTGGSTTVVGRLRTRSTSS